MRKRSFFMCENKAADKHRVADQRICFPYIKSTNPLTPNHEFKPLANFCGCVGPGRTPPRQISTANRQTLTDEGYLSITSPPQTSVMQQFDMIRTLLSDGVKKTIIRTPYVNTDSASNPKGFQSFD